MFAKGGGSLHLWDQSALLGGDEDSVAAGDERQNLTLRSLTEQHGGLRYRSESSDICLPRSRRIDSLTKRTLICCRKYKEDLDRFQAMK